VIFNTLNSSTASFQTGTNSSNIYSNTIRIKPLEESLLLAESDILRNVADIGTLSETTNIISVDLGIVEMDVSTLESELNDLQIEVINLQTVLDPIPHSILNHDARITHNELRESANQSDIATNLTFIQDNKSDINIHSSQINTHTTEIATLNSQLSQIGSNLYQSWVFSDVDILGTPFVVGNNGNSYNARTFDLSDSTIFNNNAPHLDVRFNLVYANNVDTNAYIHRFQTEILVLNASNQVQFTSSKVGHRSNNDASILYSEYSIQNSTHIRYHSNYIGARIVARVYSYMNVPSGGVLSANVMINEVL
jgi:hypothetical protein